MPLTSSTSIPHCGHFWLCQLSRHCSRTTTLCSMGGRIRTDDGGFGGRCLSPLGYAHREGAGVGQKSPSLHEGDSTARCEACRPLFRPPNALHVRARSGALAAVRTRETVAAGQVTPAGGIHAVPPRRWSQGAGLIMVSLAVSGDDGAGGGIRTRTSSLEDCDAASYITPACATISVDETDLR